MSCEFLFGILRIVRLEVSKGGLEISHGSGRVIACERHHDGVGWGRHLRAVIGVPADGQEALFGGQTRSAGAFSFRGPRHKSSGNVGHEAEGVLDPRWKSIFAHSQLEYGDTLVQCARADEQVGVRCEAMEWMRFWPLLLSSLWVAFVKIVKDDCSHLERKLEAARSTDAVQLVDDLLNLSWQAIRSGQDGSATTVPV